mgnify:FL=1
MTYESLDTNGRIRRYPEEGLRYLRNHRKALAFFTQNPRGTLFLASDRSNAVSSLAEYQEATWKLLDRRINEAGGIKIRSSRDDEWSLWRDKRAIEDLLIRRTRGARSFDSKLAKKRLPEIERMLKDYG